MFQTFGNIPVSDDLMQRIHAQNETIEPKEEEPPADNVVRLKPRTLND